MEAISASYAMALENEIQGSCTFVLLVLDGYSNTLSAASLGDSAFMIVRKGQIVYRSVSQQMRFNCPFQLGSESHHGPDDALVMHLQVEDGDLVITASDGLFDNLFDEEILQSCEEMESDYESSSAEEVERHLQKLSHHLASNAFFVSQDKERETPFSRLARENGIFHNGGKMDDITVLCSRVIKTPN